MTSMTIPSTVQSRFGPGIHLPCLDCRQGRVFHELEIEGELTYTCPQCGHQLTGDEIRGYLHPAVLQSPALALGASLGRAFDAPSDSGYPAIRARVRGQSLSADGHWRLVAILENPATEVAHENASYRIDLVDARGQPLSSEAGLCGLLLPGQSVPVVVERQGSGPFRPTVKVYSGGAVHSGRLPLPAASVLETTSSGIRLRVSNPYPVPLTDLQVTVLNALRSGELRVASLGGVDMDRSSDAEVTIMSDGGDQVTSSEAFVTLTALTLRRIVAW